ncbi:MAG: T9SS type A sorting domain-containing protein [Saprospiraceae bacterium]|nr:T9SS type A sorting domain-containing protein [Saprospiraceae bacterium]
MKSLFQLSCILAIGIAASFIFFRNSQPTNLPVPGNGRTVIRHGEEGENADKRSAWLELMHQAAPGVDWRTIEWQNQMARHQRRSSSIGFRSGECGDIETLANGQLTGRWSERGSINQAGSVLDITYDPIEDELWAISAGGSLWNSDRYGLTWSVVNQDLQFNEGLLQLIPRNNGRRLLAFSNRKPHFSDDDGQTWQLSTGIYHNDGGGNCHNPLVLGDENRSVFVFSKPTSSENMKLYRSNNQGESFAVVKTYNISDFNRIALCNPHNSNDLYLVQKNAQNAVQFFRYDPTTNQTTLLSTNAIQFGSAPVNLIGWTGDVVRRFYCYTQTSTTRKVYQSEDLVTWTLKGELPERPWDVGIYVLPSNPDILLMGEVECYVSTDAGVEWNKANNWWEYYDNVEGKIHADIMHFAEFIASDDGQPFLLVSNHGGVTFTPNHMESQYNIGLSNLNVSQYYSVRTDPLNPSFVYAGSQDQGFQMSEGFETGDPGPESFRQVISGDYGHIVFANGGQSLWTVYPGGWATCYANAQSGELTHSYDLESDNESVWIPPLVASPDPAENAAYMAGGSIDGGPGSYIIKMTVVGDEIIPSQGDFNFKTESGGGEVSAIAIAPSNSARWYAATTNGRVFRSDDGGETWEQSLNFYPSGHYLYGQALYVSKFDENTVYVAGSGYSNPAVYRSTDGGDNFEPIVSGLPSTLVLGLAANSDESLIFAATESGAYVYVVAENQWYDMLGNCAPTQTYWSVEFVEDLNTVRFGTYGRGIWDFKLEDAVANEELPALLASVDIFPIPGHNQLTLRCKAPNAITLPVQLTDLSGKVVYKAVKPCTPNAAFQTTLEVGHLPRGVYVVQTGEGKNRLTKKVILQ